MTTTTSTGRRRGILLREISSKFNDHKMITRRNWLLKCSIFANIVVLLYICSHVLVGSNTNNFGISSSGGSSAFLIQQFQPNTNQQQQQKTPTISSAQSMQDEQELLAIFKNKEQELQKQIKMQEVIQVSTSHILKQLHHYFLCLISSSRTSWAVKEV
jgi:preprotein translocase subunit SecF